MTRPRKDVAGSYRWGDPVPDAPMCACGCGKRVNVIGRRVRRWIKGHHRRLHGFDPRTAKVNERLSRVYGITRAQYDDMLAAQGGCCAICTADDPGKGREMWCVDHDHKTGAVRGLLCSACNTGIGLFHDNPRLMEYAIEYIKRGGYR